MRIDYTVHYLDNGLKIIVQPDPLCGRAAVNLLYRVGAKNEDENRTGFAHLFEHLMFGGSKNIPNYDEHVQRVGGENNAFTNNDITNYYLTVPPNQLETAFWLESDRMLELDFSQKSLDVQKSVVIEEFKQRYLNQPYGDAYLLLRPMQFKVHPYRWMTIGMKVEHIEQATLDDVRSFFFSHYAPNNCTLVVSGGVQVDEVLTLAEKWFGPIPSRTIAQPTYTTEPPQTEARSQTVHRPVPHAAVYRSYRMPARTTDAYYAADMLTEILSSGKSSRLYQSLVKEKKVATQVSAFTWGLYDPGNLSIDGHLAEGVSVAEYEAALDQALAELTSVTDAELERIQNRIEAIETFDKTTTIGRAMALAIYDSIGDAELINNAVTRYKNLTLADITASRQQVLRPEVCSTLYYLPEN